MGEKADYEFNHGKVLQDKSTGFKGTVVGRADYLIGCNQYLLVPKINKDGEFKKGCWFNEQQLIEVSETKEKNLIKKEK